MRPLQGHSQIRLSSRGEKRWGKGSGSCNSTIFHAATVQCICRWHRTVGDLVEHIKDGKHMLGERLQDRRLLPKTNKE